ncbi:MAG: hypothetical protein WA091_02715 [Minisyncoccales bacterium]
MEEGLLGKIFTYFASRPELAEESMTALRIFFNRPNLKLGDTLEDKDKNDEPKFNEWFIFDFKMKNGKTPLEYFCDKNPYNLPIFRLQMYIDFLDNEYGFFDVLKVERGEGLELRHLGSENTYQVREHLGSLDAEVGMVLTGRVGRVGNHLELIGCDPYCFDENFKNHETEALIADPDINIKKIRDFLEAYENTKNENLKNKILDDGRCICDVCGKKEKIGSFATNKKGEPCIICYKCNLEILAERDGITTEEAEKNRKKLLETTHLFQEMKIIDYLEFKNKEKFDSIEEGNIVLEKIVKAWNDLTIKDRKGFEKLTKPKQREVYQKINVDFSDL